MRYFGHFHHHFSIISRHFLLTMLACALVFPTTAAAVEADPFEAQLQNFLATDPGHFNEHMWGIIQENPQAKDHIFRTAVRLSLQKQVAADPAHRGEILEQFKQLYPQLASELDAAVMPQTEADAQPLPQEKAVQVQSAEVIRPKVRLAEDADYAPYRRYGSSWWARNWIWVALAGGAAAGGGAIAAIALTSGDGDSEDAPHDPFATPPVTGSGHEYLLQSGLGQINAAAANNRGFAGKGITVAVVDTGVNVKHPDLKGNIASGGYDFIHNTPTITDEGGYHGSHVAGIIAAGKNDFGMRGVAYEAKILPLAAIGSGEPGSIPPATAVRDAVNLATARGAQILNASYGPSEALNNVFVQQGAQLLTDNAVAQADAYVNAVQHGMILVFAAGNEYDASKSAQDPANIMNSNPTGGGFLPYIKPAHQAIPVNPSGAGFNPAAAPAYRKADFTTGQVTELLNDYSVLEDQLIAVVALTPGNTIADFSNRCGVAKNWCVGAPGTGVTGTNIVSTVFNNEYKGYQGTSMAAPMVSGALAVLMSQHPELTPAQIVKLLLDTSTDLGTPGVDAIYGHGIINLDAATASVGPFALALGTTMNGPTALLTSSSLTSSTAFGNSAFRALSATQIGVLDFYTRNFVVPLGSQIRLIPASLDSLTALRRFGQNESRSQVALNRETMLGFTMKPKDVKGRADGKENTFDSFSLTRQIGDDVAMNVSYRDPRASTLFYKNEDRDLLSSQVAASGNGNPFTDFVKDGYADHVTLDAPLGAKFRAITAMGAPDDDHGQRNMLAMGEIGFGTLHNGISFTGGALIENERVLGLRGDGAFALGEGTNTMFAGVNGVWQVEKTELQASLYGGFTRASGRADSLIQGVDAIRTSAWRVGLTQGEVFREDDSMRLNIAQPLRAESGALRVNLPQYRLRDGSIIGQNASFNLAPTGREVDVEAGYRLPLSSATKLDLAAMYRRDPGHVANTDEVIGLTRVNHKF